MTPTTIPTVTRVFACGCVSVCWQIRFQSFRFNYMPNLSRRHKRKRASAWVSGGQSTRQFNMKLNISFQCPQSAHVRDTLDNEQAHRLPIVF